jgi:PAS domain S-box-containing protein
MRDVTPRRKLKRHFQRKNERYGRTVHTASASVFEWDLQTGAFYLDPGIKAFLGYRDADIPNNLEAWISLIHDEDRQSMKAAAEAAIRGETSEYHSEHRMLAHDGSIHRVLSHGQVVRDPDGRPLRMVGMDQDITLRQQAEIRLKASEERYRMVWESAPDAMVLADRRGVILAANPAFFELFGLLRENVIDKHFTDFVTEQDLEVVENAYQSVVVEEPVLRLERQLHRQDGSTIVVDVRIKTLTLDTQELLLLAIVRDITKQKQAETAFQQARNQLDTLLAFSQNLASTLDLDPLLNLVLDQLTAVIPYDAAAILGIQHDRIEPLVYRGPPIPEDLGFLRFHFAENPILQQISTSNKMCYIEDTNTREALEQRFSGGLGEWDSALAMYRSWLALPLIVKGQLIGGLILAHAQPDRFDPAARSLAEAFANQAAIALENAWLYRQAQDTAVSTERTRLAHDLHDSVTQALYVINLYSEASRLALTAGKVDVAFQNLDELQSMAHEAVTDLRVLIYDLRPPVLEEVGLAAAIKNRLEAVEARAGIQAEFQVEGDRVLPPEVEAELFWVAQEALTNILKHAQATRVQVELRLVEGQVHLGIRDNGTGFDLQEMEAGKGMGLPGLRERVHRIGGTLAIDTSPGAGTALVIELRRLDRPGGGV